MENKNIVKGYKVFKPNWTCSPNGNTKQYACPGKFEEDIIPVRCGRGMHFCRIVADCFNYYNFNPNNKVAEVIAYGDIAEKDDKCATNKLEIVREIPWDEVLRLVNIGRYNTGSRNTGDWNTGHCNTGRYNTGRYNTGDSNAGDWNTSDWNTGSRNTGNCNTDERNTGGYNTGGRNTGSCNTGHWNTGSNNTGDYNTGCNNIGNRNTGNRNTGNFNTGDWNTGNFNTGCFMTEGQQIMMFNQLSDWSYYDWLRSDARCLMNQMSRNITEWIWSEDMTDEEKEACPTHKTTGGYLKVLNESGCNQLWWNSLSNYNKKIIKSLPNFDPKIFEEITGIKVELE